MHRIVSLKNALYRFLDCIHFPERNMPDTIEGKFSKAIKEKRKVEVVYDGHKRILEIHVFAKKNGKKGILGFQTKGYSSKGKLGWKRMYLEKMTSVRVLRERFPGSRVTSDNHQAWDEFYDIVDE